jgi:hypothetical protein
VRSDGARGDTARGDTEKDAVSPFFDIQNLFFGLRSADFGLPSSVFRLRTSDFLLLFNVLLIFSKFHQSILFYPNNMISVTGKLMVII